MDEEMKQALRDMDEGIKQELRDAGIEPDYDKFEKDLIYSALRLMLCTNDPKQLEKAFKEVKQKKDEEK
jgi:hypothetical protein